MSENLSRDAKIYVAGHRGLVGGAIVRRLERDGFTNLLKINSRDLDLRDQAATSDFIGDNKPDYVILAAAKVGGILANSTYPAQFIYDNLMIASNVIHASYRAGVGKLLNLGSSCIYPKLAPQPLKEEYMLTGPLEETNRAYAIAKIAAIELCDHYRTQYGCNFISAMPTNLYGPYDNYDLQNSHVLPAMLRKMHDAKTDEAESVEIWGTGKPLRELMHSDDLADACLFLLENYSSPGPINVGTGKDLTIRDLAYMVKDVVGFEGEIVFNTEKPDGTPRKLMDVSKLRNEGWSAKIPLREGITDTYAWFLRHLDELPQR